MPPKIGLSIRCLNMLIKVSFFDIFYLPDVRCVCPFLVGIHWQGHTFLTKSMLYYAHMLASKINWSCVVCHRIWIHRTCTCVCVLIGFITDFMNMYFKPIVMAVGQLPELAERLRNLLGTCDPQSCLVEDGWLLFAFIPTISLAVICCLKLLKIFYKM